MRMMSFMLTTDQVRAGTKTVTRRDGWRFLKVGDRVMACEKCQGLGKGGKIKRIREIEIVKVGQETLRALVFRMNQRWAAKEMVREGFPGMDPTAFVRMFIKHHKGVTVTTLITRIEFKYVDGGGEPCRA